MQIDKIPELFGIAGKTDVSPLGSGHINRTFLVIASDGCRYVLQSLSSIFTLPEKVMRNIASVETAFDECADLKVPHFLSCGDKNYISINGDIWRMYHYSDCRSNPDFRSAGFAYGTFIRVMSKSGFVPETVIDGYHCFNAYLAKLREVCPADTITLYTEMIPETFSDDIPVRVIHGDAKLDNVIVGSPCTVIDLDTVMSGYAAIDYGDLIRSVCTNGIDITAIHDITEGFAEGLAGLLSPVEVMSLFDGIIMVTCELAIRYLTDFYSSERYFRNKSREQCLLRSNELLRQLDEFKSHENQIRSIIVSSFANA